MTPPLKQFSRQAARRYRQLRDIWQAEGPQGVADRARSAAARWLAQGVPALPVRRADVVAADLSRPFRPGVPPLAPGAPITVNWVMTPPGPGSGGHTTLFRIIRHLAGRGYVQRIYLYDVHRGDPRYYIGIVRDCYGFEGEVHSLDGSAALADAHALFATSWPTAYLVFNARSAGKRFYFVQDFEPYFHPVGACSLLAENTYRMGFHAITAGRWLAGKLATEFGMRADAFDFGCDTSLYQRQPDAPRGGVVFYARPEAPRRGFELGLMALEVLAARRPDLDIHCYGDKLGHQPFAHIDHGLVTPAQLNAIYNRCRAGLSLSLTNVSLVPHEMLASGCIPVVNEAEHNRLVLDNPFVCYAPPDPHALAAALEELAGRADFEALSAQAAASVRSVSWGEAGDQVDRALRRALAQP